MRMEEKEGHLGESKLLDAKASAHFGAVEEVET